MRSGLATPNARATALRILPLIELAADRETDGASMAVLCARARTPFGPLAAIGVPVSRVAQVRALLAGSQVGVATTVGSTAGSAASVAAATAAAVAAGANEIDLTYPHAALLAGDRTAGSAILAACRAACRQADRPRTLLKVIIETGRLAAAPLIRLAAEQAIAAGADILVTASGTLEPGASFADTALLIEAIAAARAARHWVGLGVGGRVAGLAGAQRHLALAEPQLGAEFLSPATFRIAAPALLDEVARALGTARSG